MCSVESLLSLDKDQLPEAAKAMEGSELPWLVGLLSEKNDKIRYQAFLLLQYRSQLFGDVYPFWEVFRGKLSSENSYQRSIGLMLIAENARWDTEDKMESTLDEYLTLLRDEKPITVRQCIQSLGKIVTFQPQLCTVIARRLISLDLTDIRDTMRKSVLTDILHVLAIVKNSLGTGEFDGYILSALSGEILDKKEKKLFAALLS